MADESLNAESAVRAGFLDRSMLPGNYSQAYALYVLDANEDMSSIVDKANSAAKGAYTAQVRNDEQDVILDDHESRITDVNTRLLFVEGDYVSKTVTVQQSLSSSLNVTSSYSVDGVKVIGSRQNGWTPATGTALLGAFNANQPYPVSVTPTQADVAAISAGLIESRRRAKALEDAMRAHGLIN